MSKTIILDMLQKVKPNIDIPSKYEYLYDPKKKNLTIVVKAEGLMANMQDDEGAFDSWAIALKYYLKDEINTITIDWECDLRKNDKGYYHYNRFVYRLSKFIQTYSWTRSAKNIPAIPALLYCNVGIKEAADISEHEIGSEGWIECKYVNEHSIGYDTMNHQFPVGLFDGKVSRNTHYTTGQKSAIDIWAIKENCLSVFEACPMACGKYTFAEAERLGGPSSRCNNRFEQEISSEDRSVCRDRRRTSDRRSFFQRRCYYHFFERALQDERNSHQRAGIDRHGA